MELFDVPKGMVRRLDHSTSVMAAHGVKRITLRQVVLDYALTQPRGFTDHDLWALRPETPESSLRKRRSELAEENYLLDTGRTKTNENSQQAKVWLHRSFHHNPPPIREREQKISAADQIVRLEAENRALRAELDETTTLLADALPFVEDAIDDPLYKDGFVKVQARKMRRKIENRERKDEQCKTSTQ